MRQRLLLPPLPVGPICNPSLEAIDGVRPEEDEFAIVDRLAEISGTVIPQAVEEIRTAPVRHTVQCDTDQMQAVVARILSV